MRIRSNVVTDAKRFDLVPGELLHGVDPLHEKTRLQHDEHMYYQPCAYCRRTIAAIELEGCDGCAHALRPEELAGAREKYRSRVAEAREREREENARIASLRDAPVSRPED